jgi:hypothetical protein
MNNTTDTNAKTKRLEQAHNGVADAAHHLSEIQGIRVKEGVLIELEGWKALQEALSEWRSASQDLLDKPQAAKRGQIRSAHKDLNSKGKGNICYRMALHGDVFVWMDKHPDIVSDGRRLPQGSMRASDRRVTTFAEVPEGLVILEITKSAGDVSYDAGRTVWNDEESQMRVRWNEDVKHVGVKKINGAFVHVVEVDGERLEFQSAS